MSRKIEDEMREYQIEDTIKKMILDYIDRADKREKRLILTFAMNIVKK